MSRGERWTVVMDVWDIAAGTEYLVLTEVYGVYRSQRRAETDAATAQQAADVWYRTQPAEGRQLRIGYRAAPCFHPGTDILLDGLRHTVGAPPA